MAELMVVIVVIGILAALLVPRYVGAQTDTRVAAAGEDILGMVRAFEYFNANNGYWPADTSAGVMPPESRTQFKRENPFEKPCPIGGVYDYDYVVTKNARVVSISVRDSLNSPAPSIVDAQGLDAYLDDGVLNTGRFRKIYGGYTYIFHTQ